MHYRVPDSKAHSYFPTFRWMLFKKSRCKDSQVTLTLGENYEVLSLVQLLSHVRFFATPWTAACQASLSITNFRSLLILSPLSWWCHPTISSSATPAHPTFNLSQHQGLFQSVSSSHQVANYWNFSFSISPSNDYSGLISFRMDWLDLLEVQETLKSLLQHHNSKASILWRWSFFIA